MRLLIFRRILWLVKEWLYRDASWEAPCTLFSTKRRIIKGQSHEINNYFVGSCCWWRSGCTETRALWPLHLLLQQKENNKGTVSWNLRFFAGFYGWWRSGYTGTRAGRRPALCSRPAISLSAWSSCSTPVLTFSSQVSSMVLVTSQKHRACMTM